MTLDKVRTYMATDLSVASYGRKCPVTCLLQMPSSILDGLMGDSLGAFLFLRTHKMNREIRKQEENVPFFP